jgi:nitroimidazol reductase NimA-like FMN-containing flavoprotein (pyridoxamine 5'-phosphate oxidase superfamily)
MTSRRSIVAMKPEEIRAYLSIQTRIILVTNGPRGLPHAVPMEYALDDEGRVLITSFRKSQKIKNLERDPRATLLVESGETYATLKSVMAYANAEVIYDIQDVARMMKMISIRKSLSESISQSMDDQVRLSLAKRVVVRFTPFHYVTWDHRKLNGIY